MQWGALIRLGYYAFAFIMIFAVTSVVSNKKTVFTHLGACTLSIYIIHNPIIYLVRDASALGENLLGVTETQCLWICVLVALIIVFVTGLKPVNTFMSFLINPKPLKKKEDK